MNAPWFFPPTNFPLTHDGGVVTTYTPNKAIDTQILQKERPHPSGVIIPLSVKSRRVADSCRANLYRAVSGVLVEWSYPGCAKRLHEKKWEDNTRHDPSANPNLSKVGSAHLAKLKGLQDSWILPPQSVRIASKKPRSIPLQF